MSDGEFALEIGMGVQNIELSLKRISLLECLHCQKLGCI